MSDRLDRPLMPPAVAPAIRDAEVVVAAPAAAQRAGFVSRFIAFFADALVLAALLRGTVWFLTAAGRAMRSVVHRTDLGAILPTVIPALAGVYLIAFWRASGQTPGKWLMGLKVVSVDGHALSLGRAALRFVGYLISALPFYAGFLWILGPARRGWHDRLARTQVVYVRRAGAAGATERLNARRDGVRREAV
ncbi:MAG TPA: RDD family protein [Polyangia bacterium]|nr:RDD family protein [Polyangia bacterium]